MLWIGLRMVIQSSFLFRRCSCPIFSRFAVVISEFIGQSWEEYIYIFLIRFSPKPRHPTVEYAYPPEQGRRHLSNNTTLAPRANLCSRNRVKNTRTFYFFTRSLCYEPVRGAGLRMATWKLARFGVGQIHILRPCRSRKKDWEKRRLQTSIITGMDTLWDFDSCYSVSLLIQIYLLQKWCTKGTTCRIISGEHPSPTGS